MNEYGFGAGDRSQKRKARRNRDNKIQYLLSTEEQLLQLISSRAPLPGAVLKITRDCARLAICNVVSSFACRRKTAV